MSESTRDINHPVWDVYDLYRESRFSVLYYSEKLNRFKGLNSFIEIVLAITTSSSAVAVLWLWNTPLGQEIWKYVLVVSAILAIIKPAIKLTEKVQQYEEVLTGYRGLENDLKIIVVQIKQSKKYGEPHVTKLLEAFSKKGELSKNLQKPSLMKSCKKNVNCKYQKSCLLNSFFIPKDK